jgi:hypothetical protein
VLSHTGNELKQATVNYFGQDENSQPKGMGKELDAPQSDIILSNIKLKYID